MTIFYEERFESDISEVIEYISEDSRAKGKKFAREIRQAILKIPAFPYKHRKSIYFKDDTIRELTYKGYVIAYMIDEESESIRTKVEILKQVQNDKIKNLKALKASILDRAFKGEL